MIAFIAALQDSIFVHRNLDSIARWLGVWRTETNINVMATRKVKVEDEDED